VTTFDLSKGLSWSMSNGNTRTEDMRDWLAKRAGVGKSPPHGFPRDNRFG
jgi:topoisomerase IV subunit A